MSTNTSALHAFLAARDEIDTLLARLTALSEDNFQTHPDRITWGDVTTLHDYRDRLREIADRAFHEGEHAAQATA